MGIFRGEGGTGDSNTDATVTAVTEQATIATTKASEAAASAAEASTSAANSAASASSSSNSSAAAATSATQAATSATASAASATASASSATSAATAQANAETAETNAETAETNAAASATTATTKAAEAATSATSASTSASSATTKASEAATSASNAATSETNAATSASTATTKASEASTSASNAATSEANAAASYDDFDDRYLGAKSSAPSTDNDGDALITGALYFDTSSDSMKVYSGSAWLDAYASLSGALIATNNLSDLNNAGTARTNLGLGTAATTASTDYATAAQGTTADNALPKSGGAMTGAITTNSTFDGRDVSADGTKLDGIEAGATADQTASEIKTAYESNADTNAFTDADHTKLDGIEASADVTDTTNVTAAGALMDSELTSEASVKALNQGVATTDNPTFAGLTVDTDTLYVDSTNNRVGIGTSSPAESIHTTGNIRLGDSAPAELYSNSSELRFGVDKNNDNGTSNITFYVDNSEKMRIDSSGKVGIGTTSPSEELELASSSPTIRLTDTNDSTYGSVSYNVNALMLNGDNTIRCSTDGSERLRIDSSGNVGIGTTSPDTKLHVEGNILCDAYNNGGEGNGIFFRDGFLNTAQPSITLADHSGVAPDGLSINAYDGISFRTVDSERMRIDSSGNVGIGTASADEALEVSGDVKSSGGNFGIYHFGETSDVTKIVGRDGGHGSFPNTMDFFTNSAQRMRIDSSGNVGIGTTSPSRPLYVQESGTGSSRGISINTATAGGNAGIGFATGGTDRFSIDTVGSAGSEALRFYSWTSSAERMRIDSSGVVTIGGNTVWHAGNDGSGSGLDADTVDSLHATNIVESSSGITSNLNTFYDAQMFGWTTTTTGKPTDGYGQGIAIVNNGKTHNNSNNWITQLGFGTSENSAYFRSKTNSGSWGAWKTFWHSGNDGAGSGLDADNLDGVTWGSLDKDVGAVNFNVDAGNLNGLRFWNGSGSYRIAMSASGTSGAGRVSGETTSDYNMYFKMTGGTNRGFVFQSDTANRVGIDASGNVRTVANVEADYLKANRLYSAKDGSSGHFYNDSGTRTAYANGDFYIQNSVAYYYNYASQQFLGASSGDIIYTRGNRLVGNHYDFATNGDFKVNAGYGSTQLAYACRAWGRYEMIGTHSWRDAEGFSTISDLGTGRSRIYFTNTMPNTYYSVQVTAGSTGYTTGVCAAQVHTTSTTNFYVDNEDLDSGFTDRDNMHIAVFR